MSGRRGGCVICVWMDSKTMIGDGRERVDAGVEVDREFVGCRCRAKSPLDG